MKMLKLITLFCIVIFMFISCHSGQKELESIVITMTDSKETFVVTDQTQMSSIEETLSLYAKTDGIVDMMTPAPIELMLIYSDKSHIKVSLYLYETDKRSSLTYVEDDSVVYQTTENVTNQLKDIFSDVMNNDSWVESF
ncbi:MAG: hypothetical protein JEZ08_04435 [Clostridiales bacterium]|nr:hypothetical protein [Clostridiales bacterium]